MFDSIDYDVIACQQEGSLELDEYSACLQKCREAAETMFSFYRTQIEKRHQTSVHRPDEEEGGFDLI